MNPRQAVVPPAIEDARDLARVVLLGQTEESLVLEFKRDYSKRHSPNKKERDEEGQEACRDIVAFANAFGGVILVGIDEETTPRGTRVASRVVGVKDPEMVREFVANAATRFIAPSALRIRVASIVTESGTVVRIDVPAHRGLASVVLSSQKWTCEHPRRGPRGKEYMRPEEAISMALDQGRSARLALYRVMAEANSLSPVLVSPPPVFPPSALGRVSPHFTLVESGTDDHRFILGLVRPGVQGFANIAVPYGLLEDAWLSIDGRVEVMLRARLLVGDDGRAQFER